MQKLQIVSSPCREARYMTSFRFSTCVGMNSAHLTLRADKGPKSQAEVLIRTQMCQPNQCSGHLLARQLGQHICMCCGAKECGHMTFDKTASCAMRPACLIEVLEALVPHLAQQFSILVQGQFPRAISKAILRHSSLQVSWDPDILVQRLCSNGPD